MSEKLDLVQHIGDDWIIPFFTHSSPGVVLPLPLGTVVQFRLSDQFGPALTVSTADAITITDPVGGAGSIKVTDAMQTAAGITPRKPYKWELKVTTPDVVTVQAEGKFTVLPSLFVTAQNYFANLGTAAFSVRPSKIST